MKIIPFEAFCSYKISLANLDVHCVEEKYSVTGNLP